MTIKLLLLKSGETLISDVKEVLKEEKVCGYLLSNPQRVFYESPILSPDGEKQNESTVNVSLTRWMLLSKDNQIVIPFDWVVTIVDPIESLENMYSPKEEEDGSDN